MRRLYLAILASIFSWQAYAITSEPDFAYPQTVVANAEKAIATAHGQQRLLYLMEIVKAKSDIDPDSIFAMPALIAKYADNESDSSCRGLMHIYQAETLNRIYQANAYKYGKVDAPLSPLPDNPALWSADQFKQEISELLATGRAEISTAAKQSITRYSGVISQDSDTPVFFPNLDDFASYKTYEILNDISETKKAQKIAQSYTEQLSLGSAPRAWWLSTYATSEQILEAYNNVPNGIGAAYLLLQLCDNSDLESAEKIKLLNNFITSQPTNILTPNLKNRLAELTAPQTIITCNSIAAPNIGFKVIINHNYTSQYGVVVLKNTETGTAKNRYKEINRYTFDSDKDITATDTIEIKFDEYGEYLLKPIANGELPGYYSGNQVCVAPFFPYIANCGNDNALFLADYATGSPVDGAQINIAARQGDSSKTIATTNHTGIAQFQYNYSKNDKYSSRLNISRDGITYKYGNELSLNGYYSQSQTTRRSITFFTDRPIYHPGDSVNWSALAVDISAESSKVAGNINAQIFLNDANYLAIDTLDITTDDNGRCHGSFKIPTDRMAGNFSIRAKSNNNFVGYCRFIVSDFKAPTFEISNLSAANAQDSVIVRGHVATYSGVAIENATIHVDISLCKFWWRSPAYQAMTESIAGSTDASGNFNVTIPKSIFSDNGTYLFNVTATSPTAEAVNESCRLHIGKPLALSSDFPYNYIDAKSSTLLPIYCYNSNGSTESISAQWKLSNGSGTIATGKCLINSVGTTMDWDNIPAGVYNLTVTPDNIEQADSLCINNLTLYSTAKNNVAAGSPLIVITDDATFINSGDININVGVASESTLFVALATDGVMQKATTYNLKAGFNKITIPCNAATQKAEIRIATWAEYQYIDFSHKFTKPQPDDVEITVESWRDNLVPGNAETLTLTLRRTDGTAVPGSLVATMYNYALDALAPNYMPTLSNNQFLGFAPISSRGIYSTYLRCSNNRNSVRVNPKTSAMFSLQYPQYLYLPEVMVTEMLTRYMRPMLASAKATSGSSSDVADLNSLVETEEESLADAGAVVTDSADTDFEYRDDQQLQVFWMPMLNFGNDGSASISFTAPLNNGAWSFRAWAWSKDLHASSISKRCATARPLMVQPNLPRFMRDGDEATLLATVYNNTDSVVIVNTSIEIFDIADNHIISKSQLCDTISANSSAIVSINANATVGQCGIGYRIKSSAGNYADGEQSIIPVVSSEAVTYQGQAFYLTPQSPSFTTTIPSSANTINAIEICANPVWEAIKALPSLYDDEPSTALRAAHSIFAAYSAQNINAKFPEIKRTVESLSANDSDSILISNLYRNDDLKISMLQQTPWLAAAESGTERIQRIATTLNSDSNSAIAQKAINALKKLQCADGGFAWGSWSKESSLWITINTLSAIGALNSFGSMPNNSELGVLINNAFVYLDKNVKSTGTDFAYTSLYAAYPNRKPSTLAGSSMISRTVQDIIKNWKSYSVSQKAQASLILFANGNKATAKEIISSIRQFEVNSKQAGISFPSVESIDSYATILEAFAKIDYNESEISQMCQWIITRSQTNAQFGATSPMPLITAILSTSPQLLDKSQTISITINGSPIQATNANSLGYYNLRLSASDAGKKLSISGSTQANSVSYGSMLSISSQPMNQVSAYASDLLKISKRFLVERDGKWIETSTPFLGEQVRVQLIVTADADMQYISIDDQRSAAFQPVDQLPGYVNSGSVRFYRINYNNHTDLFINYLPKGVYYLTYDLTAANAGTFASGIATIQSQYQAGIAAHSAGTTIYVSKQ